MKDPETEFKNVPQYIRDILMQQGGAPTDDHRKQLINFVKRKANAHAVAVEQVRILNRRMSEKDLLIQKVEQQVRNLDRDNAALRRDINELRATR